MSAVDYESMKNHVTVHADDEKDEDVRMQMGVDTHGVFACIRSGVVVNTIIIDTADLATVQLFKAQYDDLVLIQNPGTGSPATGWRQSAPGQPLIPPPAPATLVASPATIPPDGVTASTITYTPAEGAAVPAKVTFTVNGVVTTVASARGVATLQVSSKTPGDVVTVSAMGESIVVKVTL